MIKRPLLIIVDDTSDIDVSEDHKQKVKKWFEDFSGQLSNFRKRPEGLKVLQQDKIRTS